MTEIAEVLYLARSRESGCWEYGSAQRRDGELDIGPAAQGHTTFSADPEQSFAAGWAASFHRTVMDATMKVKIVFSNGSMIDGSVDLWLVDGAYFLQARLDARLADMPPDIVQILEDFAQRSGVARVPLRGAIDVSIEAI